MIIPIDIRFPEYKKGDIIYNLEDITKPNYIILKGHKFICYGHDDYGMIIKDFDSDLIIYNVRNTKFTKDVTLDESFKIMKQVEDKKKFKIIMKQICPMKDYQYDYREKITHCTDPKYEKHYRHKCNPSFSCLKFIDPEKIKEHQFLLQYSRTLKINKLLKK